MEIIRNYLENMFQSLPNTSQVQRAKYELGQMMEDKYTELREEGKTDNEAIGIVISEFGNLDELAEDLGIASVMQQDYTTGRMISMQEAKDYISDKMKAGAMIGVGTLLCIISPSPVIMTDGHIFGLLFLFLAVAVAVGLFIFSGAFLGKWDFMKQQACSIDFSTAEYIHNEKENYRMINAMFLILGVMLCILCFVPLIILDEIGVDEIMINFGVVILLAFVAAGVFLFIMTGMRVSAYDTLLGVNDGNTMGGDFVASQSGQVRYDNRVVAAIMSVYWPTVTCIYLCWSFLTNDWHITWIIWVIASLIQVFIRNLFRK